MTLHLASPVLRPNSPAGAGALEDKIKITAEMVAAGLEYLLKFHRERSDGGRQEDLSGNGAGTTFGCPVAGILV
jgi:hypothetical protein